MKPLGGIFAYRRFCENFAWRLHFRTPYILVKGMICDFKL